MSPFYVLLKNMNLSRAVKTGHTTSGTATLMANDNKINQRSKLIMQFFCCGFIVMMAMVSPAYGEGFFATLGENLQTVYNDLIPVVTLTVFIALGLCVIVNNFTSDARKADAAQSWGKRILIGYLIFMIAPWLMKQLYEMLGTDKTTMDELNSLIEE